MTLRIGRILAFLLFSATTSFVAPAEPSPHWDENSCGVCHGAGKIASISISQAEALCGRCHVRGSHDSVHPIDLTIPKKMQGILNPAYASLVSASQGRTSCLVCHDVLLQCEMASQSSNPEFLRFSGAAHETATQHKIICFNCHDISEYAKNNPHQQIDDKGLLIRKTCLLCHSIDPETSRLPDREFTAALAKTPVESPGEVCRNCHVARPHPADAKEHFEVADEATQIHLSRQQIALGVMLPLDQATDSMHCATCHNPHQPGVIPNPELATGGDQPLRLRVGQICIMCHDM